MSAIDKNRAILAQLIAEGKLAPAPSPAQLPPQLPPIPDYPSPQNLSLSRGPSPSSMCLQTDIARVGNMQGGVMPSIRVLPLPPTANPVSGAQAVSQAIQIVKSSGSRTTTPATDVDIITGVNRQVFGSLDSSNSTVITTGNPSSISVTGFASSNNDVAVVVATGSGDSGGTGQNPGGWTACPSVGFFKAISQGSLTVTQSLGGAANVAAQALAIFRGNGTTSVFTIRASGTGGAEPFVTGSFTPAAGNSLLFINQGGTGLVPGGYLLVDSAGNNWQTLQNPFASNGTNATQQAIAYAQNVQAVSTQVTIYFTTSAGLGNWAIYEVSNLLNLSSGSYTFTTSDNNKMVLFTGGANVTATLPSSSVLPANWQALVVNDSFVGVDTITPQSSALLNNTSNSVTLQPGCFAWVFSDGTNYWITDKIEPQNIAKKSHQWLDAYIGTTGAFTQSQPGFSDLSGNIATSQVNSGTGAANNTFFRGDNTWSKIDWQNLAGAQSNLATAYNGVSLVANGIPSEVGNVDSTTNTNNITTTGIFTPGNNAIYATPYRISYFVQINRVATVSSTLPDLQFTWVDNDSLANITFGPVDSATPTANTLTTGYQGTFIAKLRPNNALSYQVGVSTLYASSGATSMQYSVHIRLEAL